MNFGQLNRFDAYWYFPTMQGLYVFNYQGGPRVAEWYRKDNGRSFHCLINLLPKELCFEKIVTEWKKYIDARLTESFDE